jgi:hypothetical protein
MLYKAQGQKWSEDRKIATYRQGLILLTHKALQSQLDLPQDYLTYAQIVLRLVSTACPSGFSSYTSGHLPVQAQNNTIDLSIIQHEPRKQIARRSYPV